MFMMHSYGNPMNHSLTVTEGFVLLSFQRYKSLRLRSFAKYNRGVAARLMQLLIIVPKH